MVWNGKTNWGGGGFETRFVNEEEEERRGGNAILPNILKIFFRKIIAI
jgi:hypothetical protein